MSEPRDVTRGVSDTRRAEGFSDAVFAIVITLLAIDLRPPDIPPGQLLPGLLQQWPAYLAYLASYLYIAVVWLNHKHAFLRIRAMDRGLHWVNLGILFATALLPFATAVLSRAILESNPADERTGIALYALVGAHLCASWFVFFHYLSRHPRLLREGVKPRFFQRETTRALAGVVLYAAAGVAGALVGPLVALGIFLVLPIFYGLTSHGLYELESVVHRH